MVVVESSGGGSVINGMVMMTNIVSCLRKSRLEVRALERKCGKEVRRSSTKSAVYGKGRMVSRSVVNVMFGDAG